VNDGREDPEYNSNQISPFSMLATPNIQKSAPSKGESSAISKKS
tara:strand:- start:256 stop:387 length:132 start_codon:yes stop_codon:yes gene_type:complete